MLTKHITWLNRFVSFISIKSNHNIFYLRVVQNTINRTTLVNENNNFLIYYCLCVILLLVSQCLYAHSSSDIYYLLFFVCVVNRVAAVILISTISIFHVHLIEGRAMATLAPFLNNAEEIDKVLSS